MLKIKNNVDLKELEEFGFTKSEKSLKYFRNGLKVSDDYQTFFETIEIDEIDRIIRTRLWNDLCNQEWYGTIEQERRLYDLLIAGLIEKVEE